jgi:hypothetical protein
MDAISYENDVTMGGIGFSVDDFDVMPEDTDLDVIPYSPHHHHESYNSNDPAMELYDDDDAIKTFEALQREQQHHQQQQQQQQSLLAFHHHYPQPEQRLQQHSSSPASRPSSPRQAVRRRKLPNNNNNNNNKQVCFAEEALLYSSDRTYGEVKSSWYNRDELNDFKAERKDIVRVLKRAHFDLARVEATGKYCLRGFEPYFSMQVNKAMKYARSLVSNLVLSEQESQRNQGIYYDPDAMRCACWHASEWARENALHLGQNDEEEVYGEYESMLPYVLSTNEKAAAYFQEQQQQKDNDDDVSCTTQSTMGGLSLSSTVLRKRENEEPNPVEERRQPPHHRPSTQTNATHTTTTTTTAVVENPELAERLESALKLVEALKFGRQLS